MAEFQFNPIDGFKNATSFPDPSTPEEARAQVQSLLDQLRDAYNVLNSVADGASGADNVGATPISTSPNTVQGILEWLKEQIDSVVANSVADNSVYDIKLSDAAGQIKNRLADHLLAYAAFVATKGQANGLASLDSNGNPEQKPYVTGVYTGNGSASQFINIGFVPKCLIVTSGSGGQYGNTYALVSDVATSYNIGSQVGVALESTGFRAYFDHTESFTYQYREFNTSSEVYRYIAFR